jgi:hypothetical protein
LIALIISRFATYRTAVKFYFMQTVLKIDLIKFGVVCATSFNTTACLTKPMSSLTGPWRERERERDRERERERER